jgi:hypothetical protein
MENAQSIAERRLWAIVEQFYFCVFAAMSFSTPTPDFANYRQYAGFELPLLL